MTTVTINIPIQFDIIDDRPIDKARIHYLLDAINEHLEDHIFAPQLLTACFEDMSDVLITSTDD